MAVCVCIHAMICMCIVSVGACMRPCALEVCYMHLHLLPSCISQRYVHAYTQARKHVYRYLNAYACLRTCVCIGPRECLSWVAWPRLLRDWAARALEPAAPAADVAGERSTMCGCGNATLSMARTCARPARFTRRPVSGAPCCRVHGCSLSRHNGRLAHDSVSAFSPSFRRLLQTRIRPQQRQRVLAASCTCSGANGHKVQTTPTTYFLTCGPLRTGKLGISPTPMLPGELVSGCYKARVPRVQGQSLETQVPASQAQVRDGL